MKRNVDPAQDLTTVADASYREHERLVSLWIDLSLEKQRSHFAQLPNKRGVDTTVDSRQQVRTDEISQKSGA